MKHLLIAAALLFTVPAFANEADVNEAFDAQANEEFNVDEAMNDAMVAPPGRPGRPGRPGNPGWGRREFQCVATNFRRQQFMGRDRMQQRAQREALWNCQRRSNFIERRTCRVVGCRLVRH